MESRSEGEERFIGDCSKLAKAFVIKMGEKRAVDRGVKRIGLIRVGPACMGLGLYGFACLNPHSNADKRG